MAGETETDADAEADAEAGGGGGNRGDVDGVDGRGTGSSMGHGSRSKLHSPKRDRRGTDYTAFAGWLAVLLAALLVLVAMAAGSLPAWPIAAEEPALVLALRFLITGCSILVVDMAKTTVLSLTVAVAYAGGIISAMGAALVALCSAVCGVGLGLWFVLDLCEGS